MNNNPTLWQSISQLKRTAQKLNNYDQICLNKLIKTIQLQEQKTIQENLLFAKLYTLVLKDFIIFYKDIDIAIKLLNKELSEPLAYKIQKLKLQLKQNEMFKYLDSKKIKDPILLKNPIEKSKEYSNLFPEIDINILAETFDYWDIDNTTANLTTAINQSIINFKNLP